MMRILRLLGSIGLCQAAGGLGALITMDAVPGWYAGLAKPTFAPPNWLFGPVWITLYTMMGVAFFLILESEKSRDRRNAVRLFLGQLALNALWTPLFFGLKWMFAAFLEILLLMALIVAAMRVFYRIRKTAGVLLLPYALWVAFAAALNLSLFLLNR